MQGFIKRLALLALIANQFAVSWALIRRSEIPNLFVDDYHIISTTSFIHPHTNRASLSIPIETADKIFRLELKANENLFTPDFTITRSQKSSNNAEPLISSQYLSGYVRGYEGRSTARVQQYSSHIEGTFLLPGSSQHNGRERSYHIEGIQNEDGTITHAIVYHSGSAKSENPYECHHQSSVDFPKPRKIDPRLRIFKRQAKPNATRVCEMALIADSDFAKRHGSSSESVMIGVLNEVSAIYEKSLNVILRVKHVHVAADLPKYSNDSYLDDLRADIAKEALGFKERDFCLVHMFTFRSDFGLQLGSAYTATPDDDSSGGICSSPRIGFTTSLNGRGNPVLRSTMITSVAHEIGHGFGAPHFEGGGGTIMSLSYSVNLTNPNVPEFAPESVGAMKLVMNSKRTNCLKAAAVPDPPSNPPPNSTLEKSPAPQKKSTNDTLNPPTFISPNNSTKKPEGSSKKLSKDPSTLALSPQGPTNSTSRTIGQTQGAPNATPDISPTPSASRSHFRTTHTTTSTSDSTEKAAQSPPTPAPSSPIYTPPPAKISPPPIKSNKTPQEHNGSMQHRKVCIRRKKTEKVVYHFGNDMVYAKS
ncbi:hypothetical protein BKA69DRAFT_1123887 [Paraphysoderma sedebokerense]|nr:hypothetical protein BKA69DRAFT_1123887 [Paraphysoderma sedebokerense]